MGRLGTFFVGFLMGGATVYASLHYHFIRADDGFHMVPKVTSTFAETYVDIRSFGLQDWSEHRELWLAIAKADKAHLFQGVAIEPFRSAVHDLFEMTETTR